MSKESEKRICWNCNADVSIQIERCPYCGADVNSPPEGRTPYKGEEMGSPFQKSPNSSKGDDPFQFHPRPTPLQEASMAVSDQEWNDALEEEVKEEAAPTSSREMVALLLLLPGIVFFLFGMLLLLFAKEGMLTLHWKQSLAFFYFLASLPLLYLGWRATR